MASNSEEVKKAALVELAKRELAKRQQMGGSPFMESAGRTFANNLLALPKLPGELLALGGAGIETGLGKLTGSDTTFRENYEKNREQFPASLLRVDETPTVQDLGASVRSIPALFPGGMSPSEAFQKNKQDILDEEAEMRRAHPIASTAGDIAGDIGTLVAGRMPFAKGINALETKVAPKIPELLFGGAQEAMQSSRATRFILDHTLLSPAMRSLARGAGRAAETGFEAASLEILSGDDPLEAAAYAAGGQAVGSMSLSLLKSMVSGGPLKAGAKIGIAAFSAGSIWQLMQSVTPGGKDYILPSLESGYNKVAFAMIIGAGAGLVGGGRLRGGEFADLWPKLSDAIATIPRAGMLSVISEFAGADDPSQMEAVVGILAKEPGYFGAAGEKIEQALTDEGISLQETINSLSQTDEKFREKLFSLMPPSMNDGKE